jgi:hypothetical protein
VVWYGIPEPPTPVAEAVEKGEALLIGRMRMGRLSDGCFNHFIRTLAAPSGDKRRVIPFYRVTSLIRSHYPLEP